MKVNDKIAGLLTEQIVEVNDQRMHLLETYKNLTDQLRDLRKEIDDKEAFLMRARELCPGIKLERRTLYYDNRNGAICCQRFSSEGRDAYFDEYDVTYTDTE